MKGRFDTLFGRLAVLIIAALVISHFSYLTILRSDHDETRVQNAAEQMAFIIKAASEVHEGNSTPHAARSRAGRARLVCPW